MSAYRLVLKASAALLLFLQCRQQLKMITRLRLVFRRMFTKMLQQQGLVRCFCQLIVVLPAFFLDTIEENLHYGSLSCLPSIEISLQIKVLSFSTTIATFG
jgi:hypothetical protein